MSRFTQKVNIPSMSLESPYPHKCVLKPQNRARFSEAINLREHMPRFTVKNECFPIYLFGNPINVCGSNPQNRPHFSEMINFRDHMPRFPLETEHFPIYLL